MSQEDILAVFEEGEQLTARIIIERLPNMRKGTVRKNIFTMLKNHSLKIAGHTKGRGLPRLYEVTSKQKMEK